MSSVTGVGTSAESIGINYLTLLTTQLRNQNPLEPMESGEMTSQLAQIAQVERLENIDGTFKKALLAIQMNEATGMIGKDVVFMAKDTGALTYGEVRGVDVFEGEVLLSIGQYKIGLDEIMSVRNLEPSSSWPELPPPANEGTDASSTVE